LIDEIQTNYDHPQVGFQHKYVQRVL
jgi:hypothetical protein